MSTPIAIPGADPVRVLLFGTGAPAIGSGVATSEEALGFRIAERLAADTGRGVRLDSLAAEEWESPDPIRALDRQQLERYDAIVVISTYRTTLAEMPLDRWLGYVIEVREFIRSHVATHATVQVLSLPWQLAATQAPDEWGGAVGRHIRTLDRLAVKSLDDAPEVLQLTLAAPTTPTEWVGSAFSPATYRTWGIEAAAQLAPRLARVGQRPGS